MLRVTSIRLMAIDREKMCLMIGRQGDLGIYMITLDSPAVVIVYVCPCMHGIYFSMMLYFPWLLFP